MLSSKMIKAMESDFRNYCHYVWKHLQLPPLTPVQNDIAYYLQHGPKRLQISAFRGVGKSYLTAAFVTWCLWKDKEKKIMVVSAGKDRADAFAIFVRNMIKTIPLIKHLEPDKTKGERSTQNVFDVSGCTPSGSPSVKSVGITGQLTGSRADIIIADDIEVVSNSATNDLREKLARLVTEFDAVIKPDGRILYLGTPQTELSLYNTLYQRGYDMRIWTALVPTEEQAAGYGAKLAPFIREMMAEKPSGVTTDPLRFTDEDLAERMLSYGRSGFALQFMLDTSLSDGDKFPLKISDLIVAAVHSKVPDQIYWSNNPLLEVKDVPNVAMGGQKYYASEKLLNASLALPEMSVMSIDPSGRGKDETAYSVALMRHGNIFVPEVGGMLGGYSEETLTKLANVAKKHKVNKIIVESNFGDGMFSQLLKPFLGRIYPVEIEEVRQNQQKELRIINTLEPLMNQHRLIIDPQVIRDDYDSAMKNFPADKAPQYMLFYQMSRLSKDRASLKHDDRLDSLSIACQYFLNILDVDQQLRAKQKKEEQLDNLLEQFKQEWYEGHGGNNNSVKLWSRSNKK